MTTPSLEFSTFAPRGAGGLRTEARRWWNGLPEPLRAPAWRGSLAALVILALLMGFHQVVQQSVRQGELLRMTAATRAEAVWRCHALNGARMRSACMAQLDAPPPMRQADVPPPNTATMQVATVAR
ncbi:MAG TPA: hypothetical protein VGP22_07370 [Albitalea sp.]|jgi:hypothetical protein|nr:hypothetical protein [Albitalea sp.]